MGFEEKQSKQLLEKFITVQAVITSSEAKSKSTTFVHTRAALLLVTVMTDINSRYMLLILIRHNASLKETLFNTAHRQ